MTETNNTTTTTAAPLSVNIKLDTWKKIVSYTYMIQREYERRIPGKYAPMLYHCGVCHKPTMVHVLPTKEYADCWVCPNCGVQDGPASPPANTVRKPNNTNPQATNGVKVLTIKALTIRAQKKEGNEVVMDKNAKGEDTNRPARFDCPVCKAHAEKLGMAYTSSMIRVVGNDQGYCCTKVMAPFGSGCRGWYPDAE